RWQGRGLSVFANGAMDLTTWSSCPSTAPPRRALCTADYAPVLHDLPTLDPVPARWLHLTMQGIGFTDEVDHSDVDAMADAAQDRCAALAPFTVTLGAARVDPEALMLLVRSTEPDAQLRAAIRAAIADVWGPDNVPEDADGFRPHVSLAYSNAAGPAKPVIRRLGAQSVTAAEIAVHRAALIDLNRDHRVYEWNDIATADLSAPTS
ncbi:MAG: 2'-5' RNA ligase family protein, partial [Pseudonocardiaceae bacterium]